MRRSLRFLYAVYFALFGLFSSSIAAELSEAEIKEIRRIEAAIEDGTLPHPPGWTFNHGASEAGEKELERVGYPNSPNDLVRVVKNAGGWAKYKADVASLLKSKDLVVRGFCAIWLADLGDPAYAKDLLTLLQTDYVPGPQDFFADWDRGQAACALGVLNAREHKNELAVCLKHASAPIRSGAATGLAWMQAKEFEKEIAALLDDEGHSVAPSAIWALGKLNATQYAKRLAEIATSNDFALDNDRAALAALVMMGAKDQAPTIARLLKEKENPLRRGQAIMALALLGCREYSKDIAGLINDPDWSVRQDAILAVGVMGDLQYAPQLAALLNSDDRSTKQSAAWALIVMESKEHAAVATAAHEPFELGQLGIPSGVSGESREELQRRFQASLARMKELQK